MSIEEAASVFTEPSAYADEPRLHAACACLRREAPGRVRRREGARTRFWALNRYDDIMTVERAPVVRAANVPRPALGGPFEEDGRAGRRCPCAPWCRWTRWMTRRTARSAWTGSSRPTSPVSPIAWPSWQSARVDHMADLGDECDFFTDVAMNYPLYIILALLGLPEEDFPPTLKLTQEMFGKDDPELASKDRGRPAHGEPARVLRVLPGPHRRPSREAARIHLAVGDRERRGRRRADRCPGGGRVLRDHRHRRPRHHQRRNQRRIRGAAQPTPSSCDS